MNKTKKILNPSKPQQKVVKQVNKKLWIIPAIILAIVLVVGILFDQLYEKVLITIDDDNYRLSDVTYYIHSIESYHNMYDSYYANFGLSYWDTPGDDGNLTMRDLAKDEAIASIISNEVMYREALANGYSLSEEETNDIAVNVTNILNNSDLTSYQKRRNGFSKKYLTDVLGKITLATRRRQDVIDTLEIDDAAIEAGFVKNDYRQYDFEYFFISTQTTDDSNNTVAMSNEDKKTAYDKINGIYESALTTEDWTTLVDSNETELKYANTYLLSKKDNETTGANFSDELRTTIMSLENNQVGKIYEGEDGYYLVRMVNQESYETYNDVVTEAITAAENEAFENEYNANILTKYDVDPNTKALDELKMGTITIN